ncbi:substrate-binding periplasmic protein [Alteromonas halophila]|uniref:ABC transporter substrate-binding protein n=1 Tax=Alteromonas halophila TaxID=516698 RepID=A0A918JPL4_9ALTE|nr:transporter substrate-binding domain-containing protein [Alteromonas halophila]GGW93408.1 ABC transporter substrate-binding protein [Alteromonas halophila]
MRTLLFIGLFLMLSPGQALAHAWLKLKIATTEYAPYTSTDMEHNGYINHIISRAFLETGVIVEFTSMSWEDAIEAASSGEYDAVSYGNFVRSREDEFWHSDPISAENLVFYVNKSSGPKRWSSLSELKEYKMGVTEQYLYSDELADYIKNTSTTKTYESDNANLEALIEGETDIFPIDELTGWYLLQQNFSSGEREEVSLLEPRISTVTTHLLVPKGKGDDRLVLALFNKGLEQLTLQGEMKRFKQLLRDGFYQHPGEQINYDRR